MCQYALAMSVASLVSLPELGSQPTAAKSTTPSTM